MLFEKIFMDCNAGMDILEEFYGFGLEFRDCEEYIWTFTLMVSTAGICRPRNAL